MIKPLHVQDEGTNVNTATIRETGQYASATVTVTCITPPQATISGVKYYDANLNGKRDPGEVAIAGWKIELYMWDEDAEEWVYVDTAYTGEAGDYIFTVTEAGTYKVVEVMPSGMWVQTAPESGYYEITVELGQTYTDNDFGNVCLMQGTGGKTLGFWSNKNGQALITSSDVTELNALNLYTPTGWMNIHHSRISCKGDSNQKLLVKCNRSRHALDAFRTVDCNKTQRSTRLPQRLNNRLRWAFNLRAQRLHKHR
jgi:hypothetical protein